MTVGHIQVWHGTADRTSGDLKNQILVMKNGRIKSKRASRSAKRIRSLRAGWTFKKGNLVLSRLKAMQLPPKRHQERRRDQSVVDRNADKYLKLTE